MNCTYRARVWFACLLFAVAGSGCGRDEVRTYQVPKKYSKAHAANSGHVGADGVHWTLPSGWVAGPETSMRLASYRTPEGGDFSLVALPDSSDLANVNRWLRQVDRDPITQPELESMQRFWQTGAGMATVYEMPGAQPEANSILAAIVRLPRLTYFFKLSAPLSVLKAQEAEFLAFVSSFHIAEDAPQPEIKAPVTADMNTNQGSIPSVSQPSPRPRRMQLLPGMQESVDAIPDATWTAPPHWQDTSPRPARKGSFSIPGPTQPADLSITAFGGNAGGYDANINRWLGQIGRPPLSPSRIAELSAPHSVDGRPGKLVFLEVDSPDPAATAILAAVVPVDNTTWFFKLTGPRSLLLSEEEIFRSFLATVNFNGDAP